jgi:two-component system invasion response regulator UvrY
MASEQKKAIKLLVADDHRIIRAGVRAMLSLSSTGMSVDLDEAETTEEAMEMVKAGRYDVILMDYQLPGRGGAKATEMICKKHPEVRVLGLSNYDERTYVEKMMQAGAMGYVLKNIEPDTLISAIRSVIGGRPFYSNEIAIRLMDSRMLPQLRGPLDRLTPREKEIFRLIMAGLRDGEIAQRTFIAKWTVDKHRQNLMGKLGAHNAAELVHAGIRLGLMG